MTDTGTAPEAKRYPLLVFAVLAALYILPMAALPVQSGEARIAFLAQKEDGIDQDSDRNTLLHGKSPYALVARGIYYLLSPSGEAVRAVRDDTPYALESRIPSLPPLNPRRALWAVRLPMLLGLAMLIFPCFHVIGSEIGRGQACLAAGMILTCWPLMVAANVERQTVFLAGALNTAWFMWYHYGRCHKNWDLAWASAGVFMLIACLEQGVLLLAVFYLPLIFLRRPFRIWQRMLNPVHLITLAAILIFSIFWAHFSHAGAALQAIRQGYSGAGEAGFSLFMRLLTFPLLHLALYLPWICLVWPAFCAAYRPLEKSPALAHFLRTIVVSFFIVACLAPKFPLLAVVAVAPAMASLAALHYPLLTRRHLAPLRRLPKSLRAVCLGGCLLAVSLLLAHAAGVVVFEGVAALTLAKSALFCALCLGAVIFVRRSGGILPLWTETMFFTAGCAAICHAVVLPAIDVTRRDAAAEAAGLVANVPADAPIFLLQRGGIAATAFHSGRRVIPIGDPAQLPEEIRTVYVWGDGKPPLLETRSWQRISPPFSTARPTRLQVLRKPGRPFGWILRFSRPENEDRERLMHMYRGDLDPESARGAAP